MQLYFNINSALFDIKAALLDINEALLDVSVADLISLMLLHDSQRI